jgi:hypothetical protein
VLPSLGQRNQLRIGLPFLSLSGSGNRGDDYSKASQNSDGLRRLEKKLRNEKQASLNIWCMFLL